MQRQLREIVQQQLRSARDAFLLEVDGNDGEGRSGVSAANGELCPLNMWPWAICFRSVKVLFCPATSSSVQACQPNLLFKISLWKRAEDDADDDHDHEKC